MAANDNDIHKALRELCTKVGGLDATVCNLQTSLEHGRSEAIRRRESLESRVEEIAGAVESMQPHVEQFATAKRHIIRAALVSLAASLGLNGDKVLSLLGWGNG